MLGRHSSSNKKHDWISFPSMPFELGLCSAHTPAARPLRSHSSSLAGASAAPRKASVAAGPLQLSQANRGSFILPFTPDTKPVFKSSLTNTEHLMEFAASNSSMLFLRLCFWEAGRERESKKPSYRYYWFYYFLKKFPSKNKSKKAIPGGMWVTGTQTNNELEVRYMFRLPKTFLMQDNFYYFCLFWTL